MNSMENPLSPSDKGSKSYDAIQKISIVKTQIVDAIKVLSVILGIVIMLLGIYLGIVAPTNMIGKGLLASGIFCTCLALQKLDFSIKNPKYL